MKGKSLNQFGACFRAFTLVELLVVMAVVALLVCLRLPAFARVRGQTTRAQCAANLKQYDLAVQTYGADNGSYLPALPNQGSWPWDMPASISTLLSRYGAQRQQLYCPANPSQNVNGLWNFGLPTFRTTGYAMAFPDSASVLADDENSTLNASVRTATGADPAFGPAGTVYVVKPSQRMLLADVVISLPGQNNPALAASYQWINIPGGYNAPGWTGHRTSHLNGALPAGGNLGMLDGHVEWRSFTNMTSHVSQTGIPNFWW
jgi:prepilin-type N-terminal cleavage/methylation domain-containing protein/prepilin-type processing-associated H-X9-DG protein